MNHANARIELLSAAVRAIAASLPPNAAAKAAASLMDAAVELDRQTEDADTDTVLAGELAGLLAALRGEARVQP